MNKYYVPVFLILSAVQQLFAQDYFPLEAGNRWFYRVSASTYPFPYDPSKDDTSDFRVLADTFMVQGKKYYTLSRNYNFFRGFVRVDSHFIYYHDGTETKNEIPYFNLRASVGDSLRISNIGPYYHTILKSIDTMVLFGVKSRILNFSEDGLTTRVSRFSDKFGPISYWTYGDPPAPWPDVSRDIIGCRLFDSSYGFVLSVPKQHRTPVSHILLQNFPNPFNAETSIRYQLSTNTDVSLVIRNVLGQEIWRSEDRYQQPGTYTVRWNGNDMKDLPASSGMYYYTLATHSGSISRKLLLLK